MPQFKVGDRVRHISKDRIGIVVSVRRFLNYWVYQLQWEDTGEIDPNHEYYEEHLELAPLIELAPPITLTKGWILVLAVGAGLALVLSGGKGIRRRR